MQNTVKITLLTVCLSVATAELAHNTLPQVADFSLMRFMARSSDLSRQNPQRSLACFDYYVPLLNSIAGEYEINYGACVDKAALEKSGVDESTQSEREEIEGTAENSCQLLSSCNGQKDSISYFECYASAGSENTKSMYAISANASEVLVRIREEYRLIDNEKYRCTNASDRAYVQNTAAAYEGLQSCLEGKNPVPTTTTSTSTTTSTTSTTTPSSTKRTTEDSSVTDSSESQPESIGNPSDKQNSSEEDSNETKRNHFVIKSHRFSNRF